MIFEKTLQDITLADIQSLVENRVPESKRLEYKRDHYGKTDEHRREFAADVSAMANASGGIIAIGIGENGGLASDLVGVPCGDIDALKRAIIQSLRSSIEPEIFPLDVHWIEIDPEKGIILIKIPRSWDSPHAVIVNKISRFYLRDENGKHPMSLVELRRAFNGSRELESRIREFRSDRLSLLINDQGPFPVSDNQPWLLLHVVPLEAFLENHPRIALEQESGLTPMGASGGNILYSLDGLVTYSGLEGDFGNARAFTTLFRNGIVEAFGKILAAETDGKKVISLDGIETDVARAVRNIMRKMSDCRISPPFYIMLSLICTRGYAAGMRSFMRWTPFECRMDSIKLPALSIDNKNHLSSPEDFLGPIFGLLWNAFGHAGSPNYDENGKYRKVR
jgi:Putative DNA-binding domain